MPYSFFQNAEMDAFFQAVQPYTWAAIQAKSHAIDHFANDNIYIRAFPQKNSQLNLLYDLLQYLVVMRHNAKKHRVLYLCRDYIESNYIFAVDYSHVNTSLATRVFSAIEYWNIFSVEQLFKTMQERPLFKKDILQLYQTITITHLLEKETIPFLSPAYQYAAQLQKNLTTIFCVHSNTAISEQFVTITENTSILGHLDQIAPTLAPLINKRFLHVWLNIRLSIDNEVLSTEDRRLNDLLFTELNNLFQLLAVQKICQTIAAKSTSERNRLAEYRTLTKRQLAQYPALRLQTHIEQIPADLIQKIIRSLRHEKKEAIDLSSIFEYKNRLIHALMTWEKQQEKKAQIEQHHLSWKTWLWEKYTFSINTFHAYNPLSYSISLFSFISERLKSLLPGQSPIAQLSRDILERSLQGAGIATGLVTISSLGAYFYFQAALLITAQQLYTYLRKEKIDYQTVSVINNEKSIPSQLQLIRSIFLLSALLESIAKQDASILVRAFSGLLGSVSFNTIQKFVVQELSEELSIVDQQFLGVLFHTVGTQLGQSIANSYYLISHKLEAREAAIQHLQQLKKPAFVEDFYVENPSLLYDPIHWFDDENHIYLAWNNRSSTNASPTFFKKACQVWYAPDAAITTIDCNVQSSI